MWGRSFIATSLLFASAHAYAKTIEGPLRVAAAADLALAFKELGDRYEKESGQRVIFSFGSTGLLAKQIEEGAPFDVFAAANISFADDAIKAGACLADSKALYARGRIVIWTRKGGGVPLPKTVAELADPRYVKIAIATVMQKKISARPACAVETAAGRKKSTVSPPSSPCATTEPRVATPNQRIQRRGSAIHSQTAMMIVRNPTVLAMSRCPCS